MGSTVVFGGGFGRAGAGMLAWDGPHGQPVGRRPAGAGHPGVVLPAGPFRLVGLLHGLSADLLSEILPLGRALHATTVRRQVQATA
jgi:hypothetical protein